MAVPARWFRERQARWSERAAGETLAGIDGWLTSTSLHVIERLCRDGDTLRYQATVEDPQVLTKPWVVPKQTLVLAPFDQIMDLVCSGTETQGLMDAAAAQQTSGKYV